MTLPLPTESVNRGRIQAMASRMGLQINLEEQFTFLESRERLDLQAAPGSGKTTLVALKLALLAEGWSASTRGICVLSHTNVAAEEIASRLSGTPGRRLLRYPHFIGTIQSFVHTFVALPALRSGGVKPRAIDDKAYAAHAERILRHAQFSSLRASLANRSNGDGVVTKATYVFEAGEEWLEIADTPFGRNTKSYRQLKSLKGYLTRNGVLRYGDMFALAEQHLHHNPHLVAGLRRRFPFLLIDEMQDTSRTQAGLLQAIFDDPVVIQRVGDINQRIYLDGADGPYANEFPAENALELSISQRFGTDIAKVASRLTVTRAQTIRGNGPEGKIAIITFVDDSIDQVVPKFEEIVRDALPPDVLTASVPRVLGGRINSGESKLFPQAISCYLPEFGLTGPAAAHETLLNTYRKAVSTLLSDERLHPGTAMLWDVVRRIVWRHEALISHDGDPAHLPPLAELDRHIGTSGHRIRTVLTNALIHDFDNPEAWRIFTRSLADAATRLAGRPFLQEGQLIELLSVYVPLPNVTRIARSVVATKNPQR